MSSRGKCLVYLLITAVLWSSSGVIIKSVEWNSLAIASSRSLVAALALFFFARKQLDYKLPDKMHFLTAVIMTMVSVTFVTATKLTTAANAIFLQYTAPVWVAILAPLILKERTSGRDWVFIVIIFGGMGLFFMDSMSAEGFWGIIIAIICGVLFAGLALAMRYMKDEGPPFKAMIYGNLLTFLVGLYFWRAPWPTFNEIGILVFAGVVQYGLSYYLFTLASTGVTSLEMVVVTMLEPILNPVWVFIAIGEKPGSWALTGGLIVVFTVSAWSILKSMPAYTPQWLIMQSSPKSLISKHISKIKKVIKMGEIQRKKEKT